LRLVYCRSWLMTVMFVISLHDALPILFESVVTPVMEQVCHVIETHFKGERASTGQELLDDQGEKNDIQAVMEILHYYFRHKDVRSEEHTFELQSRFDLVCRLLLEKKNE